MPISYADFIKYFGSIFSSNNSDDAEMRYYIADQIVWLDCLVNVAKLSLLSYVEVFAQRFTVLIYGPNIKKLHFRTFYVAYNNVYCKILGLCPRSSASKMFVTNNILNFEALMRKSIFAFTSRLSI